MQIEILALSALAALLWGFVMVRSSRGPLGVASPACLYAFGLLLFYILPSMYWQVRPWDYPIPPYYEGLPLVLTGACVMSLPFVFRLPLTNKRNANGPVGPLIEAGAFGGALWVFFIPVALGISWSLFLLTLGHQARLEREAPTIFDSEHLALMLGNIGFYYPICYFVLVALGNNAQRRIGYLVWGFDGLFRFFLLHRSLILIFIFRSVVFSILLGWKIKLRHWVTMLVGIVFIVSILGNVHIFAYEEKPVQSAFLTPPAVLRALEETGFRYLGGGLKEGHGSRESNILLRVIDDVMFRFYDARSASAVMASVPLLIPYYNGETLLHVLYALIPRYFWPEKPDLREIHLVTTWVMPNDSGLNPTGTLAELYMNYGYTAVFLGGFLALILCRWMERAMTSPRHATLALLSAYPFFAEIFFTANDTVSRRLSEGMRGIVVLIMISMLFWFCGKFILRHPSWQVPSGSDKEAGSVTK